MRATIFPLFLFFVLMFPRSGLSQSAENQKSCPQVALRAKILDGHFARSRQDFYKATVTAIHAIKKDMNDSATPTGNETPFLYQAWRTVTRISNWVKDETDPEIDCATLPYSAKLKGEIIHAGPAIDALQEQCQKLARKRAEIISKKEADLELCRSMQSDTEKEKLCPVLQAKSVAEIAAHQESDQQFIRNIATALTGITDELQEQEHTIQKITEDLSQVGKKISDLQDAMSNLSGYSLNDYNNAIADKRRFASDLEKAQQQYAATEDMQQQIRKASDALAVNETGDFDCVAFSQLAGNTEGLSLKSSETVSSLAESCQERNETAQLAGSYATALTSLCPDIAAAAPPPPAQAAENLPPESPPEVAVQVDDYQEAAPAAAPSVPLPAPPLPSAEEEIITSIESMDADVPPAQSAWPPFPDEQRAIMAMAANDTLFNRMVLAETRYTHALRLFAEYRKTNDPELFNRALAYASSSAELDDQPEYWKLVGLIHFSRKDTLVGLAMAEDAFRKSLVMAPEDKDIPLLLAECLFQREEYKEALDFYENRLATDPDFVAANLLDTMNLCYLQASLTQRGIAAYQSVLARHPDRAEVRMAMAMLYKAQHDNSHAIAEIERLLASPGTGYRTRMIGEQLLTHWQGDKGGI